MWIPFLTDARVYFGGWEILSSFLPIISLNHLSFFVILTHTLLYSSRRPLDDDLFQVSMIFPLFLSLFVLSRDFLQECVKESALSPSHLKMMMMMIMRRDTVSNPCLFPFSPFSLSFHPHSRTTTICILQKSGLNTTTRRSTSH